jgi:MYND finger
VIECALPCFHGSAQVVDDYHKRHVADISHCLGIACPLRCNTKHPPPAPESPANVRTPADDAVLFGVSKGVSVCIAQRVIAVFTRAQLAWFRGNREHSARLLRRILSLCAAARSAERANLVATVNEECDLVWQSVGDVLSKYRDIAAQHLAVDQTWRMEVTDRPRHEHQRLKEDEGGKPVLWPLKLPAGARERERNGAMLSSALMVRSEACAACGAARGARPLQACALCGLVWYCSPECQNAHWKPAHMAHCRTPNNFCVGDIVSLLSSEGCKGLTVELVGHLFVVDRRDESRAKCWVIKSFLLLPQGASVHERCIQRLLVDVG